MPGPAVKIVLKRVYDPPAADDGQRILVDRLWPRGLTKQRAKIDFWAKAAAPSTALRQWFHRDPSQWSEFRRRYLAELEANPEAVEALRAALRGRRATLLFGARDLEHNHAVVLRELLLRR